MGGLLSFWQPNRTTRFFSIFLLGFTLTVGASAQKPCASEVADRDPRLARAIQRFRDKTDAPARRDRDEDTVFLWHRTAVRRLAAVLDVQNVDYRLLQDDEDRPILELSPTRRSPLNRLVRDLHRKLGIRFVYSPVRLLRERGNPPTAVARYNETERTVFVAHDIILGAVFDHSLHHEVLHAVFKRLRYLRRDSAFHGRLKAMRRAPPLWHWRNYQRYASLEELATFSLNLHLLARDLEAALERLGDAPGIDRLREITRLPAQGIRKRSRILSHLADGTRDVLGRIGDALRGEDPPEVKFALKKIEGATAREPEIEIATAEIRHDGVSLKYPLVSEADTDAVRRQLAGGGRRDRLVTRLLARTDAQRALAVEIHADAEAIRTQVRRVQGRAAAGTLTALDLRALIDLANEVRWLTLSYVEWNGGREVSH